MKNSTVECPCCKKSFGEISHTYKSPPKGETKFDINYENYLRSYWKCGCCGHESSVHKLDLRNLYSNEYTEKTYGESVSDKFSKIISLPENKSDNSFRVKRIVKFAKNYFHKKSVHTLLDVGFGLGVFPYSIKKNTDWNCWGIDPDKKSCEHLKNIIDVKIINDDFLKTNIKNLQKFDIITLNKVIEHIENPILMLKKANDLLKDDGFIYIEVPDVAASNEGYHREEFFIEHYHVFSPQSLIISCERAGLKFIELERIREPSSKFTIVSFFKKGFL